MEKTEKRFFISYKADVTLPDSQCHRGLERFSIRNRSKFFPLTPEGIKAGKAFLESCKFPITSPKSLLFLEEKKVGIKKMNELKKFERSERIKKIFNTSTTFKSFEDFKDSIENL